MPCIYIACIFYHWNFFLHNVLRTVLIERFTSVLTLLFDQELHIIIFYTKMHKPYKELALEMLRLL